MPPCVVLLGFSTTGKSSIRRDFEARYGARLRVLDSDLEISKQNGEHVYNVYLHYRDGESTAPAIKAIEDRETQFLRTEYPTDKPILVAAGSFLSIRPGWEDFIKRYRPTFFYLSKTPAQVLDGLLTRRRKQQATQPDLASDPGFGCWDQDVTTEYRQGCWVELPRNAALANVERHMRGMDAKYQALVRSGHPHRTFSWDQRQQAGGKEELDEAIRQVLGLD